MKNLIHWLLNITVLASTVLNNLCTILLSCTFGKSITNFLARCVTAIYASSIACNILSLEARGY